MKIALLIGISKYSKPFNDLPACESETNLVGKLLEATGQYSDLLIATEDTFGAKIKSRIATWIDSHKNSEIDEIFFYYSGHGDFKDGEFYFPLSDFDKEKRKQTSLTNSEIDSWLRSLNPKLAVKVVDACHAGIPYIKDDTDTFTKYLEKSSNAYQKCYFMFSSEVDQSSYQDREFSHFTRFFVESIKQHQANLIRYRDIIDFIADNFSKSSLQTPFFVIQANNTEVFAEITPKVLELFSKSESTPITPEEHEEPPTIHPLSLLEVVQKNAKEYCDEKEVRETIQELQSKTQAFSYPREFTELYDIKYSFSKETEGVPENAVIGEWLVKNENSFFAKPTYKTEEYEVEVASRTITEIMQGPYVTKTRRKQVVSGYILTDYDQSFSIMTIKAEPKYPNLKPTQCTIAFVYSMTTIRFFYFYAEYKVSNWSSKELIKPIKWQTTECKFREPADLWKTAENIQGSFSDWVISRIKDDFDLLKTEDAT